ncbi:MULTISPECIES: hypothetical protein [Microbacterium]|uniref:hypothetical protein n=1 Tax=Microbacterium TaxID=33882 RepID=UPI0028E51073|nr:MULTISPECIES: hypothetical protein [Microbacterium]
MNEVRRDRKFLLSLELHREIARLLREDPERVRQLGLEGVSRVRPNARSLGAHQRIDAWRSMLERRDWEALSARLIGEDEESAEMRNMTVFLRVVPDARRREIIEEVTSRPGLLV